MTSALSVPSASARQFADVDDRCRFRPSSRPGVRVVARLTARCTLLCEHCLAGAAGVLRESDLPLADWQAILSELPAIGANKVLLTGGEPLLFEGIVELTAYIAAMGISTDLNSALWFVTPLLAGQLAAAGLTEASVSLAGPPDVHDRLHGRPGAWSRLVAGIRMLQDVGLPVDGSMYLTPETIGAVRTTIEQAARLGLGSFTVSRMLPVGHGMLHSGACVAEDDLAALHHDLADARAGRYGIPVRCVGLLGAPCSGHCRQGQALIGIRADGLVTPCVLTRDALPGLPMPREVGLVQAVQAMRDRLADVNPRFCYGGPA